MVSLKPGRGNSALSAVFAAVFIVFGTFWTFAASNIAGEAAVFGIIIILLGTVILLFNLKNAFGKNRFSIFDVVDKGEEPDPLASRLGYEVDSAQDEAESSYCPYCGTPVGIGFEFCRVCGKRLP